MNYLTHIEIVAAVFGFICVYLTIREHIACWPTGLVQVLLYIIVFYDQKLYSDLILHVIYVILQFYGWYHWSRGSGERKLPIKRLNRLGQIACMLIAAAGTALVGYIMDTKTDAALPYWDASILVLSLIAQYLLALKILENWALWIAVDIVAIGVYVSKHLYPTTALYVLFLILSSIGLWRWSREWRGSSSQLSPATTSV